MTEPAEVTTPQLIVEIGFTAALTGTVLHLDDSMRGRLDSATLAATDLFTDVTQWFVSGSTRRGATRSSGPTLRYEAGTATLTFRNDDRRFDPTNLSGPYVAGGVSQVEPMRAVRIRASYNGQTWPLWRGFTDQWSVNYDGPDSSYATVTCFDAFGVFSAYDRGAVAAVGAGETSGARISRILDSIAWPTTDRMIATGDETVQATTLADNVLTELLLTTDTELGELWMDADGRARFRSRSASYTALRSAYPQATFGDQVTSAASTTINLAANPSLEVDTAGWTAGGSVAPTLTRSNVRAMFGTWSLLATWGTGGLFPQVAYAITGLTVGRTYTISVYVWVPTGSPAVSLIVSGTGHLSDPSTVNDQWQRLTWTGTASSSTWDFQIWPGGGPPTAGQQVYLDGLQVEEGGTATDYVDGSQAGGEWDGVAHASTSRRLPELDYGDLTLTYDALSITNQVRAARTGGTEQTATDPVSVSAYLVRSHERSDLIMQTDPEALMWAEQVLARRSMPELRVAELLLKPAKDPDRLWAQAYGREIGDNVRVIRRPPGGGDPIVREAWVRGIEHELGKDLNWRTTLVLEQARAVPVVTDTFTRAASNAWGSADSGQAWTVTAPAADYSVSSGVGRQSLSAVNSVRQGFVNLGGVNCRVQVDITCPVLPTGGAITLWSAARATDTNNYYTARLTIGTTGAVTLALLKRTSGVLAAALSSGPMSGTHVAGNTWRLLFEVVGTTLRAKAWRPGLDFEPGGWQVTATDTSLTSGTQVGVLSRLEAGNTNTLPVVVTFDGLTATTLHAWA
ncbi:hypothetical protein [Micromonospora chersina]|uniref:phage head spike fiber domain-containing protein n=1 Tax=Micromonospora chersina TaxID=47854 RepID=UPI003712ED7F